jgi:hypothetical protein
MDFNCWSCGETVSEDDVMDADGFCPRCDAEIDGTDGEE